MGIPADHSRRPSARTGDPLPAEAAAPAVDAAPAEPSTLRVASYNLLHGISLRSGAVDLDAAAAVVAGLDADVIALQEVDRGLRRSGGVDQVAVLAERSGLHGVFAPALTGDPDRSWTTVDGDGDGDAGEAYGVGLLSRLPLHAVRRVPLPGGGAGSRTPGRGDPRNPGWDHEPRVALRARLDHDGRSVTVATAHLSYLPWRGVAQLAAALRGVAEGGGPALLIGDLNLPSWPVRSGLCRVGGWGTTAAGSGGGGGWTHAGGAPTYPSWRPRIQVDQLLVRGGVRVCEVTVGAPGTSDHLPLHATVELP